MSPSQQWPDTKELPSVTHSNNPGHHKKSSGTRKRKRTKTAKSTVETSSVAPAPAPGPVTVKPPPPSTIETMRALKKANSEIEEALELLSLLSWVDLRDGISPHSSDRRAVISSEVVAQVIKAELNTTQASEKDVHARNRDEESPNAMSKEVDGKKSLDLKGCETTKAPGGAEYDEDDLNLKFFETFEVLGEDDGDNDKWEIIDEDEDEEDLFELI